MIMDEMLLNMEGTTKNLNLAKELILEKLYSDKILTDEQLTEYMDKRQIIMFKRSWFKRWASIFRKHEDNNAYQMKYVKFED